MIFVLVTGLAANQAAADFVMDVELDFYTPMGSTVVDDRVYLLTSNAYEPLPEYGGMIMETLCFLKFNLDNLPGSAVSGAYLTMELTSGHSAMSGMTDPVQMSVQRVTEDIAGMVDGRYTVAEFQDHDTGYIGETVSTVAVYEDGCYSWDITALVNDWIAGVPNYGLAITGRDDLRNDGNQHPEFFSQDAAVAGLGLSPVISNQPVPEPATICLLGAGTGCLLCRSRRKRMNKQSAR